jgi:acyl carrier protein
MNIEDKIREFIIKNLYYAEGTALSDDASFLAEGVIDSMGAMELVAFVESEYKIKVEMSEVVVKNFDSISKLADFVRRKLGIPEPKPLEVIAQLAREDVASMPAQEPTVVAETDKAVSL